jgi:hypothetical protein
MINLWYEDNHLRGRMNGPLKVILNLKESLNECGIDYSSNENLYSKNLLLHYDANGYKKHENLEHQTCFIGPQFWPFDNYGKFLIENPQYYNQLIVPSQWVKDLLLLKFGVEENKVSIWPVGIKETNLNKNIKYDCLIYSKRRSTEEVSKAITFLESKNLSYNIISYGNYQESDFELLASQSRFCFLINGSESQGIAVQEMMSSNLPLLVWDINDWNDEGEDYRVPATSVPYWDETCGEKFYNESEMGETFLNFYDRIGSYNPREFVEKNLSYKRSVEILLEILNAN